MQSCRKQRRRNPSPPFTTSTLQQEASRKLGLGAATAMRIAQRLYEGVDIGGETVGLITYMRTDGVQLAPEAIGQTRRLIETKYGAPYVPASPRIYTSKAKNAQEAHEAIRPTDFTRERAASGDEAKLYDLIFKRAMASQMAGAQLERTTVTLRDGTGQHELRATGQVVKFPGFLAVYEEGRDQKADDDEEEGLLPMMRAHGYPMATSAGLIASGGIIAPIIPPSIGFVIFGVAANVSISKLFLAGIVPGLLIAASLVFGTAGAQAVEITGVRSQADFIRVMEQELGLSP